MAGTGQQMGTARAFEWHLRRQNSTEHRLPGAAFDAPCHPKHSDEARVEAARRGAPAKGFSSLLLEKLCCSLQKNKKVLLFVC